MNLKEYLNQAIFINRAIAIKMEEVRQLKQMGSCSSSFISNNGGSSHTYRQSKVEKLIEKIYFCEEQINSLIDKLVDQNNAIRSLISKLPDLQQRNILETHYICGKTWEQTAEENYVSLRTVYNLHNLALKELRKYYDEHKTKTA